MKRTYCIVAVLLTAVLLLAGCASTPSGGAGTPPVGGFAPSSSSSSGLPDVVRNARRNAPEGVLIGIGSAKMATQSQSKTIAETRARAELARAMDSMVQDMVRDFTASSEVDPSAVISFQENITVALARARLQGAVINDEDYVDGTYYVVMYLSKSDVVREINQAQSTARLAVPAMASFDAEARMNAAFDRQNTAELRVADRDD